MRVLPLVPCALLGVLFVLASGPTPAAALATRLEVRIINGGTELPAGSQVELRLHETGKAPSHYPLSHGEAWPAGAIRIVPVTLADPIDPAAISRFGIYFRSAGKGSATWEIASAQVTALMPDGSRRTVAGNLSGTLRPDAELATVDRNDRGGACVSDADCDDGRMCNGKERCAPGARDADIRGCVRGTPVICPVNEVCVEAVGCRGAASLPSAPPSR